MTTITEVNEFGGKLTDLVKQVQAGNVVVLTQDHRPVAQLVPAPELKAASPAPVSIRSLKGHQVLTPVISQAELAEEMFGGQ